jgi:acetolactate synthase-1/3 small subunit
VIFGECLLIFAALQYCGNWVNIGLPVPSAGSGELYSGNISSMRHVISVLLQNEVGALTRMTGLFSTRGYNIESLNVAPTDDPTVSRVTLVISGSDGAIAQLNTQLAKLVDVVNIHDMTLGEHFERELVIVKIKLATGGFGRVLELVKEFGADVLDDSQVSCTIQLTGKIADIDAFVERAAAIGQVAAVARSGSVAVSKGEVTLSSYARHHRLTG